MVESLEDSFHCARRIGRHEECPPSKGFSDFHLKEDIKKDDLIVIGSNGLWDNVPLDILHYELRGPGSFLKTAANQPEVEGEPEKVPRGLAERVERIGRVAQYCSRKGQYESPIFLRARNKG